MMNVIFVSAAATLLLAIGGGALADRGWYNRTRTMVGIGYALITLAGLCCMAMFGFIGYRLIQWV